MKKHIVIDGQTLLDVALQNFGSIEAIFDLYKNNKNINVITDSLQAGMVLLLDNIAIKDTEVVDFFKKKRHKINSTYTRVNEGIGYWGIEFDFIVT